jgi:hypothetical protein
MPQAVKQALPDANSRSPTEVLEYARDTLRAAVAKLVEAPIPAVTQTEGIEKRLMFSMADFSQKSTE